MQKNYWKHRRVLITGSGGFVGSHLAEELRIAGAHVLGVTRHPKTKKDVQVDIINKRDFERVFGKFTPSICFHLASDALVELGQLEPYSTYHNNIISSLNILETCRLHEVHRVVVASTSHVYGNSAIPYKEQEPARPSRPYETSKTCVDLMAQSYADTFHLPVLIPRFVNIYGPGDTNFDRVIPKTIKSVLHDERPTMWGGNSRREYLYIDDAVNAYIQLAEMSDAQVDKNRIYNFGTGNPVAVRELIQEIIALSRNALTIKKVQEGRTEELPKQIVSWEKALRILGWQPKVTLSQGLPKTTAWYRSYFQLQ